MADKETFEMDATKKEGRIKTFLGRVKTSLSENKNKVKAIGLTGLSVAVLSLVGMVVKNKFELNDEGWDYSSEEEEEENSSSE